MDRSTRTSSQCDIQSDEAATRIWREAENEVRKESIDRERRAVRMRKLQFGFVDKH